MRDDDELLSTPGLEFGSGVIGVCDVCGRRQAVIVLQKERFKLCVIDFLNKTWSQSKSAPGAPLPAYRSDRVWFPTTATREGTAPAVVLSPTKVVKHPVVVFTPDVYGLTTSVLDAAVRFAREGFEVVLPDVGKTSSVGPADHLSLRMGSLGGRGIALTSPRVGRLTQLFADALAHGRGRDMVDADKTAAIGLSFGASLAIALAAREPKLSALALAYPDPVTPADFARGVSCPVLVVHPERDAHSAKAVDQLRATVPADRFQLVSVPGVRRFFLSRDLSAYRMEAAETAWKEILVFLRSRLLPPPRPAPSPPKPATSPPPAPPPVPAPPAPVGVPNPPGAVKNPPTATA